MATQMEKFIESERRGIAIPPDGQARLDEARKRGLIPKLGEEVPIDLGVVGEAKRKAIVSQPKIPTTRSNEPRAENLFNMKTGLTEAGKSAVFEEAPAIAGMMAGGAVGGAIGGAGGAILGSELGGAGGEALKMGAQKLGVYPGEAPETLTEAGEGIVASGFTGLLGELGGQGTAKLLSKAAAPFASSFTKEGREAVQFLDEINKIILKDNPFAQPILISPAKATDSRILDIAENAVEASMLGGQTVRNMRVKAEDAVDEVLTGFVVDNQPAGRKPALITLIREAVNGRLNMHQVFVDKSYKRVDALNKSNIVTQNVKIGERETGFTDIVTGKPIMEDIMDSQVVFKKGGVDISEIKNIIAKESSSKGVDPANPLETAMLIRLNRKISALPNVITFQSANKLKTQINDEAFRGSAVITKNEQRIAKLLGKRTDELMGESAKQLSPEAFKEYVKAKRMFQLGVERFNDRIIGKVLDKGLEPKQIYESFVKDGNAQTIKTVRNTIRRQKGLFKEVQGEFMADILHNATDESGFIDPKKLLRGINKFDKSGTNSLSELFPKLIPGSEKKIEFMKRMGRIKDTIIRRQPDATGRLAFQFGQVAAMSGIARGKLRPEGTFILLAPAMLAKVFESEKAVKFLTEGYRIGGKVSFGVSATAKFASILASEGIVHDIMAANGEKEEPKLLKQYKGLETQRLAR